jgi:hypothetical protein
MYIYSTWVATDAPNELVDSFAEAVGPPTDTDEGDNDSRLLSWEADFTDHDESVWARSETSGRWTVAIADLGAGDDVDARFVGVLSGSPALATALAASFQDAVEQEGFAHEPAYFSLRQLLDGNAEAGLELKAVRLQDEVNRTLVQAATEHALRANLSLVPGEAVGVTVTTDEARVTLFQDGSVLFSDTTSLTAVLDSMRRVAEAVSVSSKFVGA